MPRIDLIKLRRGTAAEWTSADPTLDVGEYGFETDTLKSKIGDGSTAWSSLSYLAADVTATLQNVIANDPDATSKPNFQGGVDVGLDNGTPAIVTLKGGTGGSANLILTSTTSGAAIVHPTSVGITSANLVYAGGQARLSNYGSGTYTGTVTTIAAFDSLGNIIETTPQSPSDEGEFSGEVNLSNRAGSYYDEYDLSTDGQITFSLASSPQTFAYSYLVIDSDGATEFATKPNLDSIFNEQYNIPSDRILSSGKHALYMAKTPTGAAISIPVNLYNPDVTAPTVESATIEDSAPDELVVVFSEEVSVTDTTGLSLDNDLSGLTIDSIVSGDGTDTVTFQLSGDADAGDAGDFVYGGTNTIEDLSGNALASGTTAVTNNIPAATLTFTTSGFTEAPAGTYIKTTANGFSDGRAVTTTSFTGAFTFRVELVDSDGLKCMIGLSSHGVNSNWNDGTNPWRFGTYNNQAATTTMRVLDNGSQLPTVYTPPVVSGAGNYLEINRDGSDNITMSFNGTPYGGTLGTLAGAVYLHFSTYALGGIVYNPEKI